MPTTLDAAISSTVSVGRHLTTTAFTSGNLSSIVNLTGAPFTCVMPPSMSSAANAGVTQNSP